MRGEATEPMAARCRACHKSILFGFTTPELAERMEEGRYTIIDCYAVGGNELCAYCSELPPHELCRLLGKQTGEP